MAPTETTSNVVLIVDDHEDIRESLRDVLAEEGYRVATAANGREALRYLRENRPPCLIVLDLMMPVMNGYEFRTIQREDPDLAGIPVAVVSGREDAAENAAEMEAVRFFSKPVDLEVLLGAIADYCSCSHLS